MWGEKKEKKCRCKAKAKVQKDGSCVISIGEVRKFTGSTITCGKKSKSKSGGTLPIPSKIHKFFYDTCPNKEGYESFDVSSVLRRNNHGMIDCLHTCFAEHYALSLKADDLWLLVLQGLAFHEEATKCIGKAFNLPKKKKELVVFVDDFVLGKFENNWPRVFPEFVDQIEKNVPKKLFELIDAKFSTTGKAERLAFAVTVMDTLQNYFSFTCYTKCGIPEIHLLGKKSDYEAVLTKVKNFKKYKKLDIDWWVDALVPILENIVKTFDGKVDSVFWNSIYKYRGARGSGGSPSISGWITAFFPYIQQRKRYCNWKDYAKGKYDKCRIDPSYIPYGISYAPCTWKYLGKVIPLSFYSGFIGVKAEKDGSLKANMGWAVVHGKKNPRDRKKLQKSMFY